MSDDYAWLEQIDSEESLDWVRRRNAEGPAQIAADPRFLPLRTRLQGILDSDQRIPDPTLHGETVHNHWTDADHERGVWRRVSLDSYRHDDPDWEVLLDLDALSEAEGENWVWHGAKIRREGPEAGRFALVSLSRGGADADLVREFDLQTKTFVDGGFALPESKGGAVWQDADTVIASRDFGADSVTSSGYPRLVKRWRRGTDLAQAEVLFSGDPAMVGVFSSRDNTPGFERTVISRMITFRTSQLWVLADADELRQLPVPPSAITSLHRQWVSIQLREDWQHRGTTHPAGSLLVAELGPLLAGTAELHTAFVPTPTTALAATSWTRNHLLLTILDDVKSRLQVVTPGPDGLRHSTVEELPPIGTITAVAADRHTGDRVWLYLTDFVTPTTLALAEINSEGRLSSTTVKSLPSAFDASGLAVAQHFAISADGTRVPYFQVGRADRTPGPTLLYAYGGFEHSLTPGYNPTVGAAWLEGGGTYVVANIRGGGEYGPGWHRAALKQDRPRAYEDLAAVARDLTERGVTSAAQLGVQGGSNGGLLTGNMITRYPELFGAVVCQVPLLDMRRYSHLLAGASWIEEYGDPDIGEQWEYLRTFSPYHLYDPTRTYPPILFTTSTRDDRVHPAHARKMAARMLAGGSDVSFYENLEGGHGGAATSAQRAHMTALVWTFLAQRLGLEGS